MQQSATTKGKVVVVPNIVKRYLVLHYGISGWKVFDSELYVNPESVIQSFMEWQSRYEDERYRAKFYQVIEVELEIPFIPKETK